MGCSPWGFRVGHDWSNWAWHSMINLNGRNVGLNSNSLKYSYNHIIPWLGFPDSLVGKESTINAGDLGSIPGSGRFTGEGIGCPLQDSWSFLLAQLVKNPPAVRQTGFDPWVVKIPWRKEIPTRVFWPREFHGVAKSRVCLRDFHFHFNALKHLKKTGNFHILLFFSLTCRLMWKRK